MNPAGGNKIRQTSVVRLAHRSRAEDSVTFGRSCSYVYSRFRIGIPLAAYGSETTDSLPLRYSFLTVAST